MGFVVNIVASPKKWTYKCNRKLSYSRYDALSYHTWDVPTKTSEMEINTLPLPVCYREN